MKNLRMDIIQLGPKRMLIVTTVDEYRRAPAGMTTRFYAASSIMGFWR